MSRIKEWWLRKSKKWKLVIIAVPVLAILGVGGVQGSLAYFAANPSACGTCHLIESYVESYYESDFLDNAHYRVEEGPVKCKACHYATLMQLGSELISFVTGNYEVPLVQRDYENEFCLKCHGSYDEVKKLTEDQMINRHDSHFPDINCFVCHAAHREQVDYCSQCHPLEDWGQEWITLEEWQHRQ